MAILFLYSFFFFLQSSFILSCSFCVPYSLLLLVSFSIPNFLSLYISFYLLKYFLLFLFFLLLFLLLYLHPSKMKQSQLKIITICCLLYHCNYVSIHLYIHFPLLVCIQIPNMIHLQYTKKKVSTTYYKKENYIPLPTSTAAW